MLRKFSQNTSVLNRNILVGGLVSRSFHFKFTDPKAPVTFDNGKEWEEGKAIPTTSQFPQNTPYASTGLGYPSALECEGRLPTRQQLYDQLPSAAEAERMAMSSATVEQNKNEDD